MFLSCLHDQRSLSTPIRKSNKARFKSSVSLLFTACPVRGKTQGVALGIGLLLMALVRGAVPASDPYILFLWYCFLTRS